jgi:hypothetical protein
MGQIFALNCRYVSQLAQSCVFVRTAFVDVRFWNPQYTVDVLWIKFVS